MESAFDLAARQIGLNENDQRAAIQDFLTTGGANLDPATTAWCAAYVNATLNQSGMTGTGSNMARSFMEWGDGVDEPQRGDLAVFSRGDPSGPFGHVGFFEGYNQDGSIRVLGGNQGARGEVSISNYGRDRLLGFRRAPGGNALSQPEQPQNALAQMQDQRSGPEPFRPQNTMLDPRQFMTAATMRNTLGVPNA